MNKKMILTVIGIAIAAFIGYGLTQASKLKSIQIVTKVKVNTNINQAFDMIKYLGNFPKWSPFLAQDPEQKYYVKGIDGQIGAQYHWNGNKGKDIGYQEIKTIDSLKHIGMMCIIQKPFQAKPTFDYYFKDNGNSVEITQDFKVKSTLMDAFFMWLFGAKKQMAETNQQGLDLLKKQLEK